MQKSSEYWKKRFEQLETSQHDYSLETYKDIETAFDKAQASIQSQIDGWYARFAENNGVSLQDARKLLTGSELKELQWDVDDYIKYGRENAMNKQWMTQLENASAKFHITRLEALKLRTQQELEKAFGNETDSVDQMARKVYTEGYYHTAFEIQKGIQVGWNIGQIDERTLEKVITKPWATDGKNFSSRIWDRKAQTVNELHQELTRMLIQGKAPDEAIKHMSKFVTGKAKNAKYAAGRLVQTEEAYFHSVSQKEAFNDLGVEEYEIVATLDSRTSEICQDMDGQHFKMKDYDPGATAPPFHPNCRSVTVPYFPDNDDIGERAARNADGKTYYVPAKMTYKDWKQTFVDNNPADVKPAASVVVSVADSIKQFKDGKIDRKKLGEQILSDYSVEGVPVHIEDMTDYGYCDIIVKDGTMKVNGYHLNKGDKRSLDHQVKTAFHEAYHAKGNGYPTDAVEMDAKAWSKLEETFAESSAIYSASQYGITDLCPSYPDYIVSMLPKLKQLPEFADCKTIADFGKVALKARKAGGGSSWKELSKKLSRKKYNGKSLSEYEKLYFDDIKNNKDGILDAIIANMPECASMKEAMKADLDKAMYCIDQLGMTLSDNQDIMINNAIAYLMGKVGVK